jgi:putative NIF3 family GTP cyclohydrolase 1 type 2
MNVFYAGHYATETFGVGALGELVAEKFHLKAMFLDRSGGL